MAKPTIPKLKINEEAKSFQNNLITLNPIEAKIFDLPTYKKDGSKESSLKRNPYVVLKYFQESWECFSEWEREDLKLFSNFLRTFSSHTWDSVYKSGGKGENKGSLGYTQYNVKDMKKGSSHLKKVSQLISEDLNFFELRVSDKIRLHGFQSQSAFFLVLLDKSHRVFS